MSQHLKNFNYIVLHLATKKKYKANQKNMFIWY